MTSNIILENFLDKCGERQRQKIIKKRRLKHEIFRRRKIWFLGLFLNIFLSLCLASRICPRNPQVWLFRAIWFLMTSTRLNSRLAISGNYFRSKRGAGYPDTNLELFCNLMNYNQMGLILWVKFPIRVCANTNSNRENNIYMFLRKLLVKKLLFPILLNLFPRFDLLLTPTHVRNLVHKIIQI